MGSLLDDEKDSIGLDLGGYQSFGSLLGSSDLPALQASYSKLLASTIDTPSRIEPDAGALGMQVGLPVLLAALLKGKKGLAAAAQPATDAYGREINRATKDAERKQTTTATAAKLVGDRIGDIQDTFEKAQALKSQVEQKGLDRQLREEIANQSSADRQAMMGIMSENAKNRAADKEDRDRDRNLRADEDDLRRETSELEKSFQGRTKDTATRIEALKTVRAMSKKDIQNSILSGGMSKLMSNAFGEGKATSDKDIIRYSPPSVHKKAKEIANMMNSGAEGTLPDDVLDAMEKTAKGLMREAQKKMAGERESLRRDYSVYSKAPTHHRLKRTDDLTRLVDNLGGYSMLDSLGDDASGGVSEVPGVSLPQGFVLRKKGN